MVTTADGIDLSGGLNAEDIRKIKPTMKAAPVDMSVRDDLSSSMTARNPPAMPKPRFSSDELRTGILKDTSGGGDITKTVNAGRPIPGKATAEASTALPTKPMATSTALPKAGPADKRLPVIPQGQSEADMLKTARGEGWKSRETISPAAPQMSIVNADRDQASSDIELRRIGNEAEQNKLLAMPRYDDYGGGRIKDYRRDMAAYTTQVLPKIGEEKRAAETAQMNKYFEQKYGINLHSIQAAHVQAQTQKELAEATKAGSQAKYYDARAVAAPSAAETSSNKALLQGYNKHVDTLIAKLYDPTISEDDKSNIEESLADLQSRIDKLTTPTAKESSAATAPKLNQDQIAKVRASIASKGKENVTASLKSRGYDEAEIKKIIGE